MFHLTGIIIDIGLKRASSELGWGCPDLSGFITHLHICESNSTPAKMVEEHHPAVTFIAGSPAADMGGPPAAFQEFLARVLFVILNTETQIAPSC